MVSVVELRKKEEFSGPRTVEKGDLHKQDVVFLLLSCRRAERQCVQAGISDSAKKVQ